MYAIRISMFDESAQYRILFCDSRAEAWLMADQWSREYEPERGVETLKVTFDQALAMIGFYENGMVERVFYLMDLLPYCSNDLQERIIAMMVRIAVYWKGRKLP